MEFEIDKNSVLWAYLSDDLRGLLVDGQLIVNNASDLPKKISDYSYMVFPFSKAYEGFIKKLFLDMDLIKEDEYYGDDIRIGRILNPNYIHENENVFGKLCSGTELNGKDFAERLWKIWHTGRNQVFHYFPHNFRKLSFEESIEIINEILEVMTLATNRCYVTDIA